MVPCVKLMVRIFEFGVWRFCLSPKCNLSTTFYQVLPSHASCVCRRHPDLRSLSAVWHWQSYTAGVCLHWRGFGVDEGKPAAAKSSQDGSPLLSIITTSTPDPDWSCSCRWYLGVALVTAARDLGVYIDADITNSVRACFAALHQIRSVRRSLSTPCRHWSEH